MPVVEITMVEGRALDAKQKLCREVTDSVVRCLDAKPESVRVYVKEIPPEQFFIAGTPKSELGAK